MIIMMMITMRETEPRRSEETEAVGGGRMPVRSDGYSVTKRTLMRFDMIDGNLRHL